MKSKKTPQVLTLCAVSLFLLTGCKEKTTKPQTDAAVAVKEMTIGESFLPEDYHYSGTTEEENGTQLSFTLGGTITSLRVKVGDHVRKGQLMATVDPTSVKNSHAMALATKKQAEDAYQRMKQLHDKGSLPDIKWVEAESRLAQAVAAEEIARKNLDDCNLYAPVSGVVSEKYVEQGQNAAPGLPIIKVVSTNDLNVRVSVPEQDVSSVKIGQRADIIVEALDGRHLTGRVVEKGVVADALSRSYPIKIKVDGTHADLLPGMVAKVSIRTASTASTAIVIPSRLLQLSDDNTCFVWVDEGGKASRRTVEVGEFTSGGVNIVSGLKNGDKVIVEGQQKVCNGTKLTLKK